MFSPIFLPLPFIALSIGGIVVGVLALRRHKRAALLTIVGWSLGFVVSGINVAENSLFFYPLTDGTLIEFFFELLPTLNLLTRLASLAGDVCIFLGIYLLLERTTPSKFFTLKYDGLDLGVEKERGS